MAYQITWTNKDDHCNPCKRITHVGGTSGNPAWKPWKITQQDAIREIEKGQWSFYVDQAGQRINVVVAISQYGHKYLKTLADRNEPNTLLSLPDCCKTTRNGRVA
jgi:hypothetical protein